MLYVSRYFNYCNKSTKCYHNSLPWEAQLTKHNHHGVKKACIKDWNGQGSRSRRFKIISNASKHLQATLFRKPRWITLIVIFCFNFYLSFELINCRDYAFPRFFKQWIFVDRSRLIGPYSERLMNEAPAKSWFKGGWSWISSISTSHWNSFFKRLSEAGDNNTTSMPRKTERLIHWPRVWSRTW